MKNLIKLMGVVFALILMDAGVGIAGIRNPSAPITSNIKGENKDGIAANQLAERIAITTINTTAQDAYSTPNVGRVWAPSIGYDLEVVYGLNQADVDAEDRGVAYANTVVPGDPTGSAVLGDHNFQEGQKLAQVVEGTQFFVDAHYGQFVYEADWTKVGTRSSKGAYYASKEFTARRDQVIEDWAWIPGLNGDQFFDDGTTLYKGREVDKKGDLYLITCYPFDAEVTNQVFVVHCHMVEGTAFID